jgi:ParB family chromosome partitioning protein
MPNNQLDPIFHIEVDKIKPNPFQPRREFDEETLRELAGSIREYGVLHPLVVSKVETSSEFGTNVEYQLIAGERRLLAAKMIGLERVPAIVRSIPTDQQRLEMAIIENIQRENLNPIEAARAYAKLQDQFGLTQREVAVKLGKSREVIANAIRLLNLPSHIQDAVARGQINESQARLLLMVSDLREQQSFFESLIRDNLSVRELRSRIENRRSASVYRAPAVEAVDPEISEWEERLREILGTKVRLQKEGAGGKLTISFYSPEELEALISKLTSVAKDSHNPKELSETQTSGEEFVV